MRVLFDDQIFHNQSLGGISKYFTELYTRLPEHDVVVATSSKYSNNIHAIEKGVTRPLRSKLPQPLRFVCEWARKYQNQQKTSQQLSGRPEIFHPTYYDVSKVPEGAKLVTTVYDMIHEEYPDLPRPEGFTEQKRAACLASDCIISISEVTRQKVIDHFAIDPQKVHVVHLAADEPPQSTCDVSGLPDEYVLFVGNRKYYKNFDLFLNAMSLVHCHRPELKAVCSGREFSKSELQKIRQMGLESTILSRKFSDRELMTAYQNATLFVFPSLHEGFGLPIVEAFSVGCPVALSDIEIFREVADDAAAYFNPHDPEALSEIILKVAMDEPRRRWFSEQGLKRFGDFSWHKTAQQTADIYRETAKAA